MRFFFRCLPLLLAITSLADAQVSNSSVSADEDLLHALVTSASVNGAKLGAKLGVPNSIPYVEASVPTIDASTGNDSDGQSNSSAMIDNFLNATVTDNDIKENLTVIGTNSEHTNSPTLTHDTNSTTDSNSTTEPVPETTDSLNVMPDINSTSTNISMTSDYSSTLPYTTNTTDDSSENDTALTMTDEKLPFPPMSTQLHTTTDTNTTEATANSEDSDVTIYIIIAAVSIVFICLIIACLICAHSKNKRRAARDGANVPLLAPSSDTNTSSDVEKNPPSKKADSAMPPPDRVVEPQPKPFRIKADDINYKGPLKMKRKFDADAKHAYEDVEPSKVRIDNIVFAPELNEAVAIGKGIEEHERGSTRSTESSSTDQNGQYLGGLDLAEFGIKLADESALQPPSTKKKMADNRKSAKKEEPTKKK